MITYSGNDILELPGYLDDDGKLYYTFYLRPPAWTLSTEMVVGDIVSPTTPTGYIYLVKSSGITGATEPTWATSRGVETVDNTVSYRSLDNTSYLTSNGTLVSATFSATESVPLSNPSSTTSSATVQVGPVPVDTKSFELTLNFEVSSGHATNEIDERTVKIIVEPR